MTHGVLAVQRGVPQHRGTLHAGQSLYDGGAQHSFVAQQRSDSVELYDKRAADCMTEYFTKYNAFINDLFSSPF